LKEKFPERNDERRGPRVELRGFGDRLKWGYPGRARSSKKRGKRRPNPWENRGRPESKRAGVENKRKRHIRRAVT